MPLHRVSQSQGDQVLHFKAHLRVGRLLLPMRWRRINWDSRVCYQLVLGIATPSKLILMYADYATCLFLCATRCGASFEYTAGTAGAWLAQYNLAFCRFLATPSQCGGNLTSSPLSVLQPR